jgi:hypothetical protein
VERQGSQQRAQAKDEQDINHVGAGDIAHRQRPATLPAGGDADHQLGHAGADQKDFVDSSKIGLTSRDQRRNQNRSSSRLSRSIFLTVLKRLLGCFPVATHLDKLYLNGGERSIFAVMKMPARIEGFEIFTRAVEFAFLNRKNRHIRAAEEIVRELPVKYFGRFFDFLSASLKWREVSS